MSNETRAAHLARLKVRYQAWRIRELPEGRGYRASSRAAPWRSVEAPSVVLLEIRLFKVAGW